MDLEGLGVIGNGQFAALVDRTGDVVWCCLPRFDAEPVFGTLLDPDGGVFAVRPADESAGVQSYLPNTNVLTTTFTTKAGSFRLIDFAPRFELHGRTFHPTQLYRVIEPLAGTPMLSVRCEPVRGWSKLRPPPVFGSNHVRFEGYSSQLRLTTDLPLAYLDGRPTALTARRHLALTWGEPVEEPLAPLVESFLSRTVQYWQTWVKHCNIPPIYQQEVIRAALTLKLHCYEDTGAIIAAVTTSIPEAPGSGRTWDYRYCWLRDAYYALSAFGLLGHFEEREAFIHYLLNIAASAPDLQLAPLYRIDGRRDLDERIEAGWAGFGGDGPVRVGNAAAAHTQNDIFGEMVLALAPVFLDDRFAAERTPQVLDLIERLARKALSVAGTPDAGIWEVRTEWKPQTFSNLMCWAAADRMHAVAARHRPEIAAELEASAARLREQLCSKAWSAKRGALAATYGGDGLDASLLQAPMLRLLPPDDPRLRATVETIRRDLAHDGWIRRYDFDDGFGAPAVAFTLCTFWLVEALAKLGLQAEAREVLGRARAAASPIGLMSEDYDPVARRMWGNFPQAYSHVGLIHAAFAAAPSWLDVL